MKASGIMAAGFDQTIDAVVRELVRAECVNGVWYINLPSVYPDGSFVTVRIDQAPGGFRVSDGGFAYREAEKVEAVRSFRRIANSIAEQIGVSVADRSVFVAVSPQELERAIIDVSEASWRIADRVCHRVWDQEGDDLPEPLRERLQNLFGAERFQENVKVTGSSTNEWSMSAVVNHLDHSVVFQAVRDQANSLYKASTAFRDISLLPNAPRLVAVVQSKESIGNKLTLLAPGRVIEEGDSDAQFLRAAA